MRLVGDSMITFQTEKFDDCYEESIPMLEAHYLEIATDKSVKPLVPDLDQYHKLEEAGCLHIVTARHVMEDDYGVIEGDRGRLIGYFVTFVHHHLHYSQTKIALNDIMYIDPEYRGGTAGYRLIKYAIHELKNLGADILIIHMKVQYPFRNLLEKLGFHLTEENWERVL